MSPPLGRRALAEFLGTGLLVAVVVGSGIAAENLSRDGGLRLLENTLATGAGLAVLILVLGPVSGAHFNPVISLADWLLGRQAGTGLTPREVLVYLPSQLAGGIAGAALADAMFAKTVGFSSHHRSGGHVWLGELVATAGLLLVIVGLARAGKSGHTPWAVGAYIAAAYWFTSSTSFANPAVSIGRAFTDTFAGIAPSSLPGFIGAQLVGAGVGLALIAALFPAAGQVADQLVVPHAAVDTSAKLAGRSR